MLRLDGKKVVVTGGGSGIGREICKVFAREGAKVVVADINETGGEETAKYIQSQGGWSLAVKTDIACKDQVVSLIATAAKEMTGIDIIVNNAAAFILGAVESIEDKDWAKVFEVNVTAAASMVSIALPHLKQSKSPNIVNIASISSYIAQANQVPYNASKGALLQLTKCLALDLGEHGIRVNAVCPGDIHTEAMDRVFEERFASVMSREKFLEMCAEKSILKRTGTPNEVANVVLFLASDEASFVTGAHFVVDGGQTIF